MMLNNQAGHFKNFFYPSLIFFACVVGVLPLIVYAEETHILPVEKPHDKTAAVEASLDQVESQHTTELAAVTPQPVVPAAAATPAPAPSASPEPSPSATSPQPGHGKEQTTKTFDNAVELTGDKVEYGAKENIIVASGHVKVTNKKATLYCDELQFYRDEKVAVAKGNIVLESPKGTITGDRMTYSFATGTGNFGNAGLVATPFYGHGGSVAKVADDQIEMKDAYITTCDDDVPHYRMQSSTITVDQTKRVIVARGTKLYVGSLPIFYLPRFTQKLDQTKPTFLLIPGYKKTFGAYALGTYRYELNEAIKGVIHGDIRDKRGLGEGVDVNYKSKGYGEGAIRTYYTDEHNITSGHFLTGDAITEGRRERFKGEWRHKWQVDNDTSVVWQYYKLSDSNFLKDYFEREYRQDADPQTYFLATKNMPNSTLSLRADYRVNRYEAATDRLPEVKYNVNNIQVGDSGFYFNSENTSTYLAKRDAEPTDYNSQTYRMDTNNIFSYPWKIAFVETRPYVGDQTTYYSHPVDPSANENVRNAWRSGIDVGTKFSKVFDVNTDRWGMDIHRLRHIIAPTITYEYDAKPNLSTAEVGSYDTIDTLAKQDFLRFGLENKLQTKSKDGQQRDLVRLLGTSTYRLSDDPGNRGFNDVNSEFDVYPNSWLRFASNTHYDAHADHLTEYDYDFYVRDGKDKWSFGVGDRWDRGVGDQITTQWAYTVNPIWRFNIYQRVDTSHGILQEQQYTLTRDMHEWELDLMLDQKHTQGVEAMFVLRLKAFPDIGIKGSAGFTPSARGSNQ